MGFVGPAIGLGSSIFGAIAGHKSRKATDQSSAQANSLLTRLAGQSDTLFKQGMPALGSAQNYFQTLLSGDRGAMRLATAAPAGAITDQYRGAEAGLERAGVRGGERATALAELQRDKAAKIAGLTTGVQPAAASSLSDIGTNLVQMGQRGLFGAAGGQTDLMKNRLASQGQAFDQNTGIGKDIGRSIGEIIKWKQGKSPKGVI